MEHISGYQGTAMAYRDYIGLPYVTTLVDVCRESWSLDYQDFNNFAELQLRRMEKLLRAPFDAVAQVFFVYDQRADRIRSSSHYSPRPADLLIDVTREVISSLEDEILQRSDYYVDWVAIGANKPPPPRKQIPLLRAA